MRARPFQSRCVTARGAPVNRRAAKRYALGHLADLAVIRAGLIEGHYGRGESWDQLPLADARRVIAALIELGDELKSRAEGRRAARPGPVVDPDQAILVFEEDSGGS